MMKTRWLGVTLFLMGMAIPFAPAHGQEKVEWTALEGKDSFYQELVTKTEQTMKVQDQTNKQTQNQTFVFKWTPVKKDGDNYVVTQEIIIIKMDINIGGNMISYDSTKKDQPKNPMTEFFGALKGAKFTLTLNPKEQSVEKVEGVKDLVDSLTKINAQMKPLLEQILSESAVKQMAEPMLTVVPKSGEFKKDEEWTPKSSPLDMGPIGSYTTKNTYKCKNIDKDKGLAEIDVSVDLSYQAPKKDGKAKLPFTIKEEDTTLASVAKDSKGKVYFNIKKGIIESSTIDVTLKGNISIEIAGMETSVELEQTQKTTLKTLEEAPKTSE